MTKPYLRKFQKSDVKLYRDWMNDPIVLGAFVQPDDRPLSEMEESFESNGWQGPDEWFFMYVGDDDTRLGYAHWWKCDRYESHIEFGRVLVPPYRGTGIGSRFLETIVDKIFTCTDSYRIQAITACENKAVLKQWKNVGIKEEGTLREFMTIGDQRLDCKLGSILRNEWRRLNG